MLPSRTGPRWTSYAPRGALVLPALTGRIGGIERACTVEGNYFESKNVAHRPISKHASLVKPRYQGVGD